MVPNITLDVIMFPTQSIRSATQRKILRVLSERNKRYTPEELAEMCQRSKASISRALQQSARYPFIDKKNIPGSKEQSFRLNPESEYTTAIRRFYETERRRERQDGTIPVKIWNLLEDITVKSERKINGLIELFLYGSYATGDYYAGSDIDLLLLHQKENKEEIEKTFRDITDSIQTDKEIQMIPIPTEKPFLETTDKEAIHKFIYENSPIQENQPIIPLTGEIEF